jgi:hypothetical protein
MHARLENRALLISSLFMARAHPQLIEKLREAAANIESGKDYNWGHIGKCNCGHLVQTLTEFTAKDIASIARANYVDEWTEFANDYCPINGVPIDKLTDILLSIGFELKDVHQLEYLSNPDVLKAIPGSPRKLEKGKPRDAALYMRTWAGLLELELNAKAVKASKARASSDQTATATRAS